MAFRHYLRFLFLKAWKPGLPVAAGTLLVVFLFGSFSWRADGRLHLTVYDVGQGDALFIKTPKGSRILVDGGPGEAVIGPLSWDLPFFDRSLDLVVLTHPHADHVSGLVEVLKRYRVRHLVFNPQDYDSAVYAAFLAAVEREKSEGAAVYSPKEGDKIRLGDEVSLKILWSPLALARSGASNPNNLSLIAQLKYKDFDAFLPGDQEVDEFKRMVKEVSLEEVEVLKVAHHGSRNGLSKTVWELLRPKLAIISAGRDNAYGHPSPETLEMLRNFSVQTRRTDQDGRVEVVTDGKDFWLK